MNDPNSASFWKRIRSTDLLGGFLVVIAVTYSLLGLAAAFVQLNGGNIENSEQSIEREVYLLQAQVAALKKNIKSDRVGANPLYNSRMNAIEDKQRALDLALSGKTDVVISIAKMRSDLDRFQESSDRQIKSLEVRLESVSQLLFWTFGALITTLLAVIGWLLVRKGESD